MEIKGLKKYLEDKFPDRSLLAILQIYHKVIPMFLRGLWWRVWLKQTNGLVLIGRHVTIRNPQYITAGADFVVEDFAEIQGLSQEGVIFGKHVVIRNYAIIKPSGYYGRKIGVGLKVGDYSNIGNYCYLGCGGGIEIGNHVMMSPRVSMHSQNHNFDQTEIVMRDQGVTNRRIRVEDNCWLASGCIILSGVTIGKGSIVAAGSVVTKDVPPYSVVAGSPARVIRHRSETES